MVALVPSYRFSLIFGCVSASDGSFHSLHYHVTCYAKSEHVIYVVSCDVCVGTLCSYLCATGSVTIVYILCDYCYCINS